MLASLLSFLARIIGRQPAATASPVCHAPAMAPEKVPDLAPSPAPKQEPAPEKPVTAPPPAAFTLTAEALAAIAPGVASAWLAPLNVAMAEFEINTPPRAAAFLAQILYESNELRRLTENLNYTTAQRLVEVFDHSFPSVESTRGYVGMPERIANRVYADKLGNGGEASGDGWRFRGRSPVQLTGRDNYAAASDHLGIDLVADPDRALDPATTCRIAAWFFALHGCLPLADSGQCDRITRAINGPAMEGAEARRLYWQRALKALTPKEALCNSN